MGIHKFSSLWFELFSAPYLPISGIHEMVHRQGLVLERSTPALSYHGTASIFGSYRTPPGGKYSKYEIEE